MMPSRAKFFYLVYSLKAAISRTQCVVDARIGMLAG
jgi:hypothetical protein